MTDVITLIEIGNVKDELGTRIPEIINENEIFASKKSVRSSEFYQAQQSGMEVVAVFRVWSGDYNNERVIRYNDEYFTVIRTYEKGDFIEISTTKRQGVFQEATR